MPWPQSQDYNEAIQNPQSSFGDPELRGGQAVTNAMGMPMPRSGNFADVYEFIGASGQKWAIKCFTRQIPGLQERYGVISKSLAQAKLPFMVDFDYLAKGIRIRGEFFPVLKMHWVEGFLLNEFVRNNLDKPSLLDALGQVWLRMAIALRRAGFAHADLQHGNVILIPGSKAASLSVRLIDYDGMWVPALAGKKSGEVGHANYQHPQRLKSGIYSVDVDRFPHLVIYTALRGLMVGGPELWNKYDNGDNLLFKQADLDAPSQSPLFAELLRVNNPEVRKLTEILARAVEQPLERTPFVDGLAAAEPAARPTGRKSEVMVEPMPRAESAFASITEATRARGPARAAKKAKVGMMVGGGLALVGLVGLAIVGILLATGGKREEGAPQLATVQPPQVPKQVEIGASSKKELDLPKDHEPKKDATAKKDRDPAPPVKDVKEPVRPDEKLEGLGKEKTKQPDGPAEKPEPPKKEAKGNDAPAPKIDIPNKDKVDRPEQRKVVYKAIKLGQLLIGSTVLVPGLEAEFFKGDKLQNKVLSRIDADVYHEWGAGSPAPEVPADRYSCRWQGWLLPPEAGRYSLFLGFVDGARLYLDGRLIIDGWKNADIPQATTVVLDSRPHHIMLERRKTSNDNGAIWFHWSHEGKRQPHTIPKECWFHVVKDEQTSGNIPALPVVTVQRILGKRRAAAVAGS